MDQADKNLLLYIAEALIESLKSDSESVGDTAEVMMIGKKVEVMGRYIQSRGTGGAYMKMTKAEFIRLFEDDEHYEGYVIRANEIEAEGGFQSPDLPY